MTKNITLAAASGIASTASLQFAEVLVTPALATEWLAKNFERNRSINKSAVARYAAEMKAGLWKVTHQGIAFDDQGRLVDGQHRLLAIKSSGVSVAMVVSYYLSASPLENFDRGTIRSVGDGLEVSGFAPRGRGGHLAAGGNMIAILLSNATSKNLSREQVKKVIDTHRAGLEFAFAIPRKGGLSSPFVAAAAYTSPICPQRIASLFKQAIDRDNTAKHSGAWHLAELLHRPGNASTDEKRLETAHTAIKCIRLHMEDREVKLLKICVEGVFDGLEWAKRERAKLGLPLDATGSEVGS